ncbi:DUF1015 domain-containing protein [Thermosulfuriphilus sp.]
MAIVVPFRGFRYNQEKINLEDVVAPPYDVVTPVQQESYLSRDAYNIFHLELGRILPGDNEEENRYTRASNLFKDWLAQGILIQEAEPVFYYYEIDFILNSQSFTRHGFIALVRLEDWSSGIIRPHERTFESVTSDRLRLLRSCRAQFSQVFCLYPDPKLLTIERLKATGTKVLEVREPSGIVHRLFRVSDPKTIGSVKRLLEPQPLYIADGHHRYTTALSYRNEMRRLYGSNPHLAFNYIMMYLCPIEDEGLVILPTHRILKESRLLSDLERSLGPLFKGVPVELDRAEEELAGAPKGSFVAIEGEEAVLFEAHIEEIFVALKDLPLELRGLEVTIFTELVLKKALGFGEDELKRADLLSFTPWGDEVLAAARRGHLGFLLKPTMVEELRAVSDAGLTMPHKSTYFYPKILTGLVLYRFDPQEELY